MGERERLVFAGLFNPAKAGAPERGGDSHSAIRAGGGLGLGWERGSADVFAGLFNPAKACATERGGDNYFCVNFSHDVMK